MDVGERGGELCVYRLFYSYFMSGIVGSLV